MEFDKVRWGERRPYTDDTISRKQVATETVTVSRRDMTRAGETVKGKYPKEVDIGRIVIEEIPEEELVSQGAVKKKTESEVTATRQEVRDVPKTCEKEDTFKVGKLDLRDLEKEVVESTVTEERLVTRKDKIDHTDKIVTDQRMVRETRRGPADVVEEKLRMGRRPGDEMWLSVEKRGETDRMKHDKTDGRWYVDEKTGKRMVVESTTDLDVVHGHEVVRDSVWEESRKPLEERPEESVVSEKTVPGEKLIIPEDDRKTQQEDVRVSVRKVESTEKKDEKEMKVRRFKIDESRDARGVKKDMPVKEILMTEKKEKERKPEEKIKNEVVPGQPPTKVQEKRKKEKETKIRERIDERHKRREHYEKKEKERSRRAQDRQRYEEERYHMKRASSEPWIEVKRREKRPEFEVRATQVIHEPTRSIDKYDGGVYQQPATLPWIEVRRRETGKQREKSRHSYQLTQEQGGRDRLLLLKIPQKIFISLQKGDKSKIKEIEIPWMEIEASRDVDSESLPWIELVAHDSKTQRDRLIMLKIPREMVLKTSRFSRNGEREIQLPWNDVTRYWEETGQIPLGSAVRMRMGHSPSMSITLPREVSNGHVKTTTHHTVDNLPTIRLIMPKKFYAERSLQDRPLINFDPDRRIKLRFNSQFNSKANEDVRTIRLGEYDRKSNYIPVALTRDYPRHVLLADGTAWKRLEINDLQSLDKEKVVDNPSRFRNAYEIGREAEAHSFPDLRKFAKENGGKSTEDQKIFSFVINSNNK